MMKTLMFVLLPLILFMPKSDKNELQRNIHFRWQQQLEEFVSKDGTVNYKAWRAKKKELDLYIGTLEEFPPMPYWSKKATLSYWINVYNALTVQLILEHYPVESIKDIPKRWDIERFVLGDKKFSLSTIEHSILRKMGEPRIHFAINCASVSCPNLQPYAFMDRQLEKQLEHATRAFLCDPTKNVITGSKLELSKIFSWFSEDFGSKAERLEFISHYSGVVLDNPSIRYLTYDWNLNE